MGFWILALTGALLVIAILGWAMVSSGGGAERANAEYDLGVYRDQLRELDRDRARGTIGAEEAERAKVEISRRLLEADRKAKLGSDSAEAPKQATWLALALVAALIVGGGAWLYEREGAPGYWDLPLSERFAAAAKAKAARPDQAADEAQAKPWAGPPPDTPKDYLTLIDKLRKAVAQHPDDQRGQLLLASNEAQLGNYRAARAAMKRVLELKGDKANAADWSQYAELMVLAAGGRVSPQAEAAVDAALKLDAKDPVARYYKGLAELQIGRPDLAFPIWRDLLENSDPNAPWVAPIRAQIMPLAQLAGVPNYQPPEAAPASGPSAADMAAAQDMSPADRAKMIDSMVTRLMDRLANQGGPASDWAKLITALTVQGKTDRAQAILDEARQAFAGHPDGLKVINAAAAKAGLAAAPPTPAPDAAAPDASPAPDAGAPAANADLPGPSAGDMAAAQDKTPEERARMINDMVTQLADRLGSQGGTPEEWARLIRSYGALGKPKLAQNIWDTAKAAFPGDDAALATLRAAAKDAGLVE